MSEEENTVRNEKLYTELAKAIWPPIASKLEEAGDDLDEIGEVYAASLTVIQDVILQMTVQLEKEERAEILDNIIQNLHSFKEMEPDQAQEDVDNNDQNGE